MIVVVGAGIAGLCASWQRRTVRRRTRVDSEEWHIPTAGSAAGMQG